ncbi:carboxypeptidase-like regulatory domain-containing protein [Marilutibacter maris]|uniref:carboxypeptidase-like regulatory domain-containing protein n=1 Tax=Marilutibacter maris TaxID=1605891 RepID=UPI003CCD03EE
MKKIALLLALALLAAPFMANAGQLSSDFRGRVVDAQGQAVPGAVMMVEAIETGRVTRHVANAKGRWHAVGLRSDLTYRVSCYAPGAAVPAVRFQGRVLLGQVHFRNCVIGQVGPHSPAWLSSWQWRQAPGERYVLR